jgi:3',5'-cyclic AMP phosphodiesterase CpdA
MATIRLLHISDPHILRFLNIRRLAKHMSLLDLASKTYTFAGKYNPKKLSAFLRFIRPRQGTIDGIILTGDIATTGRDFDLRKAFEVVQQRIQPIGIRLGLLPGNHDRWIPHRKGHSSALLSWGYDPGGKDFHRIFSSFWGPKDVRTFPFEKNNFRVAIIAADLSLRKSKDAEMFRLVNKHGQGKAYDDIVKELEAATLAATDNTDLPTVVVWAIHFPPYCPDIANDMRLLQEEELIDKAESLGVPLILSGHSHVARAYEIPTKDVRVFCAGSLSEYTQSRNNFFIINVEHLGDDYSIRLENYEYDRFRRRFVKKRFTFG